MGNFYSSNKTATGNYYGFDLTTFNCMPKNVDRVKIMSSLLEIVEDDTSNNLKVDFSTSNYFMLNSPYIELLYFDIKTNQFYVYSTNTGEFNLITSNGKNIILTDSNVIVNGSRKYMWDAAIKSSTITTTEEFPLIKNFSYINDFTGTQLKMKLIAKVTSTIADAYETNSISRSNNYIWYPGSMIYCLVDGNTNSIYIMQSVNNTNTNLNLSSFNCEIISDELTLPKNWQFLYVKIPDNETVVVVSTSLSPVKLITDSMGNSYQYVNKEYNEFLYDDFF